MFVIDIFSSMVHDIFLSHRRNDIHHFAISLLDPSSAPFLDMRLQTSFMRRKIRQEFDDVYLGHIYRTNLKQSYLYRIL